jgi:hypothetical protein
MYEAGRAANVDPSQVAPSKRGELMTRYDASLVVGENPTLD